MTDNKRKKSETQRWVPPNTLLIEMNGTLVHSFPALYQTYKELLLNYGYELSKLEFREVYGLPPQAAIPLLCDKCNIKKPWKKLYDEFLLLIGKYYTSDMPLVEGIREFLQTIDSPGLSVGLVTTMPFMISQAYLVAHHLNDLFDEIISLDQWDPKTFTPNIFLYALDQLNAQPTETMAVVFSDASTSNALDAGMLTIKLSPKGSVELKTEEKQFLNAKSWETVHRLIQDWYLI